MRDYLHQAGDHPLLEVVGPVLPGRVVEEAEGEADVSALAPLPGLLLLPAAPRPPRLAALLPLTAELPRLPRLLRLLLH